MRVLVLTAMLLGCGGVPASASGPDTLVRADLACTETQPTGELDCVAQQGCTWGPPPFCSGEDDGRVADVGDATRPCVCTCEADLLECASRP